MAQQPHDIKLLSGIMNTDDSNEIMPSTHHPYANNIVWRGNQGNMRPQNIPGTRNIPFTKQSGDSESIGAYYDSVKQRVFFFIYNSGNLHGIYQYNLKTGIVTALVVCGVNTDGDILEFTLDRPIVNINIIYGDETMGDMLTWINCQKLPCKLNIDRALSGGYGTIIYKSYFNVAKAPATVAPSVIYQNDAGVTINNLRKKLFKFKQRLIYDDLEKSTTGTQSEVPLPYYYADQANDADPTKNCVIFMTIQTGAANVKKIEILGSQNISNVFSDFFSIITLDKSILNIADNDTYTYKFYNNQAYNYIDVEESIELFDYVPLEANASELLNGNTLIYGGIKEGYNLITSNMSVAGTLVSERLRLKSELLYASQLGQTGFTTGNIRIIVAGIPSTGDILNIVTLVGATPTTITYTIIGGDTVADILTGLSASAIGGGFAIVSTSANDIVVSKTSVLLSLFYITVASNTTIGDNSTSGQNWGSINAWGYVEFDENGITNGVVTQAAASVQNLQYTETATIPNIPKTTVSIYTRPSLWARSFSIVRTKDLTKSNLLYWVSDRTFKDENTQPDNYKYAYISIENLNTFIKNNQRSPLGYDFAPNDRIRFVKSIVLVDGVPATTVLINKDFEIAGQSVNPKINEVTYTGQFLKIVLPTTDVSFDFGVIDYGFIGVFDYNNYFIEIYTPAESVANGLDFYYEIGERYTIGNPGTVNAFHQGMIQNQSTNLVTPALFTYTKGEYYYRDRTINVGVELDYQSPSSSFIDIGRFVLPITFVTSSYIDAEIEAQTENYEDLAGFNISTSTNFFLKNASISKTFTFNIKGSISFTLQQSYDVPSIYLQTSSGVVTYLLPYTGFDTGAHTVTFNVGFTLSPGEKIFAFFYTSGNYSNDKTFALTDITVTRELNYTEGVVDPNFSDLYPSAVNSDGRAFIVDNNARQTFFGTLLRWGKAFQQGTNINQMNRFYGLNFDQIDSQKGDIQRLKARERILRVFQARGTAQMGIYAKFLQDSGNTNIITTTDEIITTNNVNYYAGTFGIGDQYTALASSARNDYFIDSVTGDHIRLAQDGMTSLNELYKGQYYIRSLFVQYNKTWTKPNGAAARIILMYDFFEQECISLLQGGANGSDTISDITFAFNEKRNAYSSFYDLYPEWFISAQDKIILWKDGDLYINDDTNNYCNFLGVQYYPSITLVFNDKEILVKTFNAIAYQSNQIWISPTDGDINTSMINPETNLQQTSNLQYPDYEIQEGIRKAALNKDVNSSGGVNDGDYLKGNWIEIKMVYKNNKFAWLFLPYIKYELSNENL